MYVYDNMSLKSYFGMRNVSDKNCRENQNAHFILSNFSPENRAVYEIMWKNTAATSYGACALHAGYLRLQTHTENK
jgi:hypothetical protein